VPSAIFLNDRPLAIRGGPLFRHVLKFRLGPSASESHLKCGNLAASGEAGEVAQLRIATDVERTAIREGRVAAKKEELGGLETVWVYPQLADLRLEGLSRNSQLVGRARSACDPTSALGQRCLDQFPLVILFRPQQSCIGQRCRRDRQRDSDINQVSSIVKVSPSHRIMPRSTRFCSSRMLPGHL
jgi:hypothetical protein